MQPWEEIPEDEKAFQLRLMEVPSGFRAAKSLNLVPSPENHLCFLLLPRGLLGELPWFVAAIFVPWREGGCWTLEVLG